MKTICFYLILFMVTTPILSQDKMEIKSAKITFTFVNNDVDGSISDFKSSSNIDFENLSGSTFEGSAAVETLKTGNFLRDWSLKGGKYFDADAYPQITFTSSEVLTNAKGFTVKGTLTIKDTSKPIAIDFIKNGKQLTGTVTLNSYDYGIQIKKNREQNNVVVQMIFDLQ
ncbi:YceI family protein [Maribacter halichondriae]|uniref:YceI family protein n=1 Tax=Maribacter halichondriae TaxID=2980554 RepID=UPI0023582DD1|nr:YceI family protein [Maribacter sp. Hal144]